jgi:hypothetical protein
LVILEKFGMNPREATLWRGRGTLPQDLDRAWGG